MSSPICSSAWPQPGHSWECQIVTHFDAGERVGQRAAPGFLLVAGGAGLGGRRGQAGFCLGHVGIQIRLPQGELVSGQSLGLGAEAPAPVTRQLELELLDEGGVLPALRMALCNLADPLGDWEAQSRAPSKFARTKRAFVRQAPP